MHLPVSYRSLLLRGWYDLICSSTDYYRMLQGVENPHSFLSNHKDDTMSNTAAPSTAVSEPAPTQTPTPTVYLPSRAHEAGSPLAFDSRPDGKIGGTWYIVGSSLPLWKSKKNVVIRYVANATAQGGEVKFDDEIRSDARSQKAPEGSGRKMRENVEKAWKDADGFKTKYFGIKGTNTLQDGAKNG